MGYVVAEQEPVGPVVAVAVGPGHPVALAAPLLPADVAVVELGLEAAVVAELHALQIQAGGRGRGARDQVRVEAREPAADVVGVIDLLDQPIFYN